MNRSILTVETAADSYDLTTLDVVKDELRIVDDTSDERLARWVSETSDFVRGYCDQPFVQETISELWRERVRSVQGQEEDRLILGRRPVKSITSITVGQTVLETGDYEVDFRRGYVYRLWNDRRVGWHTLADGWNFKLAAVYVAGYAPTELPSNLVMACLEIIKHRRSASTRDPNLKSREVPGELAEQWWVPGSNEDGIPSEIRALLDMVSRKTV